MIYKTFEEWAAGNWLEDGEPRKEAYTKDELLLIEMGWNYGVDAERKACAKECDRIQDESLTTIFYGASNEYREGRAMGANLCGTAIRARREKND